MKITARFLMVPLACLALASCNNSDNQKQLKIKQSLEVDSSMCTTVVKRIFYNLPSPIEITQVLLKTEEPFNRSLLNSIDNLDKYNTSSSQSLNFGVYGADLCYCRVYDQLQDAINYLSTIKKITEKLNIPEDEGSETINRIEQNLENGDSIYYIISETYAKADSYLKENERDLTAALILVGAWVEGMHFATNLAIQPNAKPEIIDNIVDQRYTVENLIALLSSDGFKNLPEIAILLDQFSSLQVVYRSLTVTQQKATVITDQKTQVTTIDAPKKVEITKEQLKEIADIIAQTRDKVVN